MTPEQLHTLISQGESETLEFKTSFSKAVIETLVAFSNSRGGQVLIGVDDKGNIKGLSITDETVQKWINEVKQKTSPQIIPYVDIVQLETIAVVVLSVIDYPIKPVSFKDRYYKRVINSNHIMSLSEVSNEHLRTINESWDYYTDPNHSLEDISFTKVDKYIQEFQTKNDVVVSYSSMNFLRKQEILKEAKLTFGAYLLFAKELCIISDIQVGRFKGNSKIIDSISLDTDLFTELDEILKFIKKNLMVEFIITGDAAREEKYDYPINAIREIVINMLIHRDYRDSSSSLIKIFDDRIEFYNPGELYGGITINNLWSDNYTSKPRNKLIAKAFREIHKIERYGSGINRIIAECANYGIIDPKFEEFAEGFRVTIFKEKLNWEINDTVNDTVNERQTKIIELINKNNRVTINQLADICKVKRLTVVRDLKLLKNLNIIVRIGPAKGGHWELVDV